MTTSVMAIASAAFLRAEAMCPGNHWMGMEKPALAVGGRIIPLPDAGTRPTRTPHAIELKNKFTHPRK
ncbi:MAG: hypothetical protein L6Q70_06910, partial [Thauera sp.]|nr:hypothetical protein [Thauera sp.]